MHPRPGLSLDFVIGLNGTLRSGPVLLTVSLYRHHPVPFNPGLASTWRLWNMQKQSEIRPDE